VTSKGEGVRCGTVGKEIRGVTGRQALCRGGSEQGPGKELKWGLFSPWWDLHKESCAVTCRGVRDGFEKYGREYRGEGGGGRGHLGGGDSPWVRSCCGIGGWNGDVGVDAGALYLRRQVHFNAR